MNKTKNWWEYLDWKEMKVVLTHYAIWSNEIKEFVRKSLDCEDCFGWSPDVCGENCSYTLRDAKEWVKLQSSGEKANEN